MASILTIPQPNKEPRQKSIDVSDLFLTRVTPPWSRPSSLPAYVWRLWVLNQPVAVVCRETLIANLLALDWKITPRNSKYKEELDATVRYYTRLFEKGGDYPGLGLDFSGFIEWIVGDLLDLPFGGAAEIGRKGGSETGRVQWIRPLDGGTLYPTLNQDFPVLQYYPNYSQDIPTFRPWEISRTYMSPHSFILREGWGMAPPEKIYFALDLLTRSDKYYANLLLDIPTAGILDLGDMEKSSAEEWISAFKTFVNDVTTSFKIPVLYEHNNPVEFISLGKVPNDIMFDKITNRYAALTAAAYGMSLSDIGLQTTTASGETLAGSIRQERRTRKTGFSRVKNKTKSFFDHILPDTLEFTWIDYDDELNVAMGRARLASSQAFKTAQDQGWFSDQEIRSQWIADGLSSISLPDEIPPEAKNLMEQQKEMGAGPFAPKMGGNAEPELVKSPKAPSAGGEGKSFTVRSRGKSLDTVVRSLVDAIAPLIRDAVSSISEDELAVWRSTISDSLFDDIDQFGLQKMIDDLVGTKSLVTLKFESLEDDLRAYMGESYKEGMAGQLIETTVKSLNGFLGRTVVYLMSDALFNGQEFDASSFENNLQDFIAIHINDEAQKVLNKIRQEN